LKGAAQEVVRRVRLISGLILFAYILSHFLNHALGLVSLAAMERALEWFYWTWGSRPGQLALYGALTVHFTLALYALWQRRTLRLRAPEAVQYLMGFAVPLLVVQHVVSMRVADSFYGLDAAYYANVVNALWRVEPFYGVVQMTLIVVAWVHATIGLRFWLRLRPWYDRAQPVLFALAVVVPVLAILGFTTAGREVADLMERDPQFAQTVASRMAPPEVQDDLHAITWGLRLFFVGSIAAMLVARLLRSRWQRRHGVARITYPDGRFIDVTPGTSVLEASRLLGYPHASVCGGKGRCSTCRVRLRAASGAVAPPSEDEAKVLHRVAAPPNVRLACMLRPRGPVEVTPLLPATAHARDGVARPDHLEGHEQEIAILFADLRSFTQIAESKLPYDVVFLLNRYFAAMGRAIEEAGGRVDKFIGDGIMALFGLESGASAGCREAIGAARLMSERMEELNAGLAHEIDEPLRIGIGIHTGPAIVGEMGFGRTTSVTAIGDAVNTASRIEALCKEFGCELVVSGEAVERAGLDFDAIPAHEIEVRGRRAPLLVRVLARGRDAPVAEVRATAITDAGPGAAPEPRPTVPTL
jgi:adenylate cyclase